MKVESFITLNSLTLFNREGESGTKPADYCDQGNEGKNEQKIRTEFLASELLATWTTRVSIALITDSSKKANHLKG